MKCWVNYCSDIHMHESLKGYDITQFFQLQVFSEIDQDKITELSQQVGIGFLALAILAGLFYFGGVGIIFH